MCLGIPGRIVELVDAANHLAVAEVGGVRRTVNIACLVDDDHPPEACVGAWVLLHVGFALGRIDEEEAQRTLELFKELEEFQSAMQDLKTNDAIR